MGSQLTKIHAAVGMSAVGLSCCRVHGVRVFSSCFLLSDMELDRCLFSYVYLGESGVYRMPAEPQPNVLSAKFVRGFLSVVEAAASVAS